MDKKTSGFTLIELLVTLAIVGLLLSIVAPRYIGAVGKGEETVLQHNLQITRDAIDKFYGDQGRYPANLDELVTTRYLRNLPYDPVSRSSRWQLITADDGSLRDLRSMAAGAARNGTPYASW